MSRYYLKVVAIEGFRGINNEGDPFVLRLRSDCVNSVFAHNAAGKSSVFEAIQYAITGSVRKLDDLHEDERGGDYYINRFHSQDKATITVTLAPDDGQPAGIRLHRSHQPCYRSPQCRFGPRALSTAEG